MEPEFDDDGFMLESPHHFAEYTRLVELEGKLTKPKRKGGGIVFRLSF